MVKKMFMNGSSTTILWNWPLNLKITKILENILAICGGLACNCHYYMGKLCLARCLYLLYSVKKKKLRDSLVDYNPELLLAYQT